MPVGRSVDSIILKVEVIYIMPESPCKNIFKVYTVTFINYLEFFFIYFFETRFTVSSQQLAKFLDYQRFCILTAWTSTPQTFEKLNIMQKKSPLHKYPLFFLLSVVSTENCSGYQTTFPDSKGWESGTWLGNTGIRRRKKGKVKKGL